MNALTNLHRVLRPGGLILDVQPAAVGHREVLVEIDGRETPIGDVSWMPWFVASMQSARKVLDGRVAEGLFERGAEKEFLFREYHDTRESWQESMAERFVGRLDVDDSLLKKALDLMPEGRAEIVTEEGVRALVLHRV